MYRFNEPMSDLYFKNLDKQPQAKKDLAAIDKRADLFETRIFRLKAKEESREDGETKDDKRNILVLMRDPGSANALLPVVEKLARQHNLTFITDGKAMEALKKQNLTVEEEKNTGSMLDMAGELNPDLILTTRTGSEPGLESFARATFSDTPIVIVEDQYTTASYFLNKGKELPNLQQPEKICVQDETAKSYLVAEHPEFADRVVVTGQPSFDNIYNEPREQIREQIRGSLGLEENDKLIIFFTGIEDMRSSLKKLLDNLSSVVGTHKIKFMFRPHPRNVAGIEQYQKVLEEETEKVDFVDMEISKQFTTDQVDIAADIIVTTPSTVTYESIYREKPVVNVTGADSMSDPSFRKVVAPAIDTGSSFEVEDLDQIRELLPNILENKDGITDKMLENQRKNFPQDGKNSERVVKVIQEVLESKKK